MKLPTDIFSDILCLPNSALCYELSRRAHLAAHDLAILETEDYDFDPIPFAESAGCEINLRPGVYGHWTAKWQQLSLRMYPKTCVLDVSWRGEVLILIRVDQDDCAPVWLILARSLTLCEQFFVTVCNWETNSTGALTVFQNSEFQRDENLREQISNRYLENLQLTAGIRGELEKSIFSFFRQKDRFKQFGIPWKRGLILHGPPGNGKTQTIQAVVNESKLPAIYVRSVYDRWGDKEANIKRIFQRAREIAPCFVILEDIDVLIGESIRSYFLNEMDGFQPSEGVLTIATTNHLNKLDVAIRNRPSRFDQKIEFGLPQLEDRLAYLNRFVDGMEPNARPSAEAVQTAARETKRFSFASLQEVVTSYVISSLECDDHDAVLINSVRTLNGTCEGDEPTDKPKKKKQKTAA